MPLPLLQYSSLIYSFRLRFPLQKGRKKTTNHSTLFCLHLWWTPLIYYAMQIERFFCWIWLHHKINWTILFFSGFHPSIWRRGHFYSKSLFAFSIYLFHYENIKTNAIIWFWFVNLKRWRRRCKRPRMCQSQTDDNGADDVTRTCFSAEFANEILISGIWVLSHRQRRICDYRTLSNATCMSIA